MLLIGRKIRNIVINSASMRFVQTLDLANIFVFGFMDFGR